MDEYRFQVDLNWRRSQYFFILSSSILVAAGGLLAGARAPNLLVTVMFSVGGIVAALALLAARRGKAYYHSIRDLKGRLESRLALGDLAIQTTEGMKGKTGRRFFRRVTDFQAAMLIGLMLADAIGAAAAALSTSQTNEPERHHLVVAKIRASGSPRLAAPAPLVFSQHNEVRSVATARPGELITERLEAGNYLVQYEGATTCQSRLAVRADTAVTSLTLNC